jgi:trehalose 6-phosphate synthase
VQDYHLALVPKLLKAQRPDVHVGLFWHIPWPNPEAFRICPWRSEILEGMLGADLVGFHLQQFCNNFLETVDRMVEARLDWDHFAVENKGHTSIVRPFPISIESWQEKLGAGTPWEDSSRVEWSLLNELSDRGDHVLSVGVDRLDYTKGIPERLRAIDRFLEKHPAYRGKFTFVQLAAPSRSHLRRYRDLTSELEALADEVNWKYQSGDWKPVHLLIGHHDSPIVYQFLKRASICIVSSLHDGMNLVAKEYVAANDRCDGVLILSEFAGAARELSDALIINPYDTEQFADAIRYAVEMDRNERQPRMERMRRKVEEYNIYRWAAQFLTELSSTSGAQRRSRPETTSSRG